MDVALTIELGEEFIPGQRYAAVKIGDVTVFGSHVYDNIESTAERNILLMFGYRMRQLLEDEDDD